MNPTKAQAKAALGFKYDTQLADLLGIHKQSLSRVGDDDPLPDAYCWKGHLIRPDVFGSAPTSEAD